MQPTSYPIAAWIEAHAPAGTAVAAGPIIPAEPFDDVEAAATARAGQIRRDEFHTGRRLARVALAQLGCPPSAIPVGDGRVPVWPEGFLGTISHSRKLCVAHVGSVRDLVGIGIDIEPDVPLVGGIATQICRPDEDPADVEGGALLRFVAKEAFYKAYFPAARSFLEFHDVRIDLDLANGVYVARIVGANKPEIMGKCHFEGRFTRLADHIVAALWIRA
jgi:4'-phosphopantetheinyl transferase EntD